MSKKKIEQKIADTILQKSKTIKIGGDTYEVAPPTIATLILVSEEVAKLPQIKINKTNDILTETLKLANQCSFLGDIVAVLILGANHLIEQKKIEKKYLFGLVKIKKEVTINKQKELAEIIIKNMSPKKLNTLLAELLSSMEIGDFFGLTTSLIEINLTKPTKEVETIVSGL